MTKSEFIAAHIAVCKTVRCKKYDTKKGKSTLHSITYSRKKCARKLWREREKRNLTSPNLSL
jgi:hypothetical protein